MKNVITALNEIKNTQGTNNKIDLLSTKKEDKLLLSVLNLLFNPTISTKLASKKIEKDIDIELEHKTLISDIEFINFLQNECTGKDSDILSVQEYIDNFQTKIERETLKEIACQSLSIGMDYKNINKALGYQLVELLEPMLAYPLEKRMDKIKNSERFSASLKLDGFRALIKFTERDIEAYSRNGLKLEGFDDFLAEIKDSLPFVNMIYDGELLTQKVYKDSAEGFRALSKVARTKGRKNPEDLCFHCFDCVPYDEFIEGESKKTYLDRRFDLEQIQESNYIKVVKSLGLFTVDSPDLFMLLDDVVANGSEGLMLNNLESKYETKRSTGILKMKKFHTCDIRCVGVEEGTGNFKGTLGSIVCDYKGYKLNVGTGFSQAEREYYWNNPSLLIGNIVEIRYFEESSNSKDGGLSLRFPSWIGRIRTDKNEPSYN